MSDFKCETISKSIVGPKQRLIVIGDLHADFDTTKTLFIKLKLIKIINNNIKWVATPKDTVVVQLGDQLDGGGRGVGESSGELEIIDFMENLHSQALLNGGGVYSLIGNHEVMNLLGDFRYASSKDINNQGGETLRKKLFAPGGDLFNKLSCTRNVVLQVGDFIFSHAGIVPENFSDFNNPKEFIKYINKLMREFLQGKKDMYNDEINKHFINKDTSLIWNRKYGNEILDNDSCDKVEEVSNFLKVNNMIVGHTIQTKINSKCNKKLWRVDVGLSKIFNNEENIGVLEILDNGIKLPKNNFNPFRIIS